MLKVQAHLLLTSLINVEFVCLSLLKSKAEIVKTFWSPHVSQAVSMIWGLEVISTRLKRFVH